MPVEDRNNGFSGFEVEKENGKYDMQYSNAEGGVKDARLAEADDDGRWPPRDGGDSLLYHVACVHLSSRTSLYCTFLMSVLFCSGSLELMCIMSSGPWLHLTVYLDCSKSRPSNTRCNKCNIRWLGHWRCWVMQGQCGPQLHTLSLLSLGRACCLSAGLLHRCGPATRFRNCMQFLHCHAFITDDHTTWLQFLSSTWAEGYRGKKKAIIVTLAMGPCPWSGNTVLRICSTSMTVGTYISPE